MPKIATCCYCGTRAALVIRSEGRHELSCAACGAPLREMKAMPVGGGATRDLRTIYPAFEARRHKRDKAKRDSEHHADQHGRGSKRRNSGMHFIREAIEEVWDTLEDVFD
ncbi:hypothetical protein G5B38_18255 [Pseudohalocynthiibacter aestuariivivens]|nr:hypothetical protein [Pseudohalocynthiibacter aestuariivivens]QIE44034.1 hypothetical protein G5B38_18255 [Pseudohalocynthiibacter aestuariivivens]